MGEIMRTMLQVCLFLSLLLLAGCVPSDQYQMLENRVNALEMENSRLKILQARFEDQAADLTTIITDLEDRVHSIDEFSGKTLQRSIKNCSRCIKTWAAAGNDGGDRLSTGPYGSGFPVKPD